MQCSRKLLYFLVVLSLSAYPAVYLYPYISDDFKSGMTVKIFT